MSADTFTRLPRWVAFVLAGLCVLSVGYLNYGNYANGEPLWALVVNTLLLAIPTGLLFFSIWVLLLAWQQHRCQGCLGGRVAKLIYWTPRLAGVVITLFLTLFSLDVFGTGEPIWRQLLGFVIHSVPSLALASLIVLAWRRDQLGFWMFALAAGFFLALALPNLARQPLMEMGVVLLFAAPMAVIAAMYWVNWKWRATA